MKFNRDQANEWVDQAGDGPGMPSVPSVFDLFEAIKELENLHPLKAHKARHQLIWLCQTSNRKLNKRWVWPKSRIRDI